MAAAGILGTTRSPRLNATSSECYVKPHTMIFAMKIKLSVSKQTRCRIRMKAFKLYVLHVAILKRLAFTTSGWAGEEVVNLTAWFFWLAASTKKKTCVDSMHQFGEQRRKLHVSVYRSPRHNYLQIKIYWKQITEQLSIWESSGCQCTSRRSYTYTAWNVKIWKWCNKLQSKSIAKPGEQWEGRWLCRVKPPQSEPLLILSQSRVFPGKVQIRYLDPKVISGLSS